MFTSSIPVELVKIDNEDLKYVIQKKGDSLDVHISYMEGQFEVNFKYIPTAEETHKYSVRIDSKALGDNTPNQVNYIIRYFTGIQNTNGTFVTDSNGLEKLKRLFGEITNVVDANYYPLTRFIYIEDQYTRQTIMVDRAQGGTSAENGTLEVMFNRKSTDDDNKGAFEGTNEGIPLSVLHYIVIEDVRADQQLYRQHQVESDNPMFVYKVISGDDVMISKYGRSGSRELITRL